MNETTSAWISVEERLPDDDELVIAFSPNTEVTVSCWERDDGHWRYEEGDKRLDVTHWMPLPAPPARALATDGDDRG